MEVFSVTVSSTAKRHSELTSEWASPAHRQEGHWKRKERESKPETEKWANCVARAE